MGLITVKTFDNVIDARKIIGNVKKVIVTHSPKAGIDFTLMNGVNEAEYDFNKHDIISSSICDANAVAASSIFHFTRQTPLEAKKYLLKKNIKVRPVFIVNE